jgi:tripartite ATP-independent transporter DctM subunit
MIGIILILVLSFFVLLLMNAPVAVAIAFSSLLAILANGGDPGYTVAQRMANGVDSFPLLAIPFFVFSGYLMGRGGLARRLIDFAALFVGRLPGGLGYVNTLTCMLFGSISGSAAAAVSSIGGFMIPEMNKKGYNREFNVAVTATAATTGLLIPPSNAMIVYSVAAGSVSIAAMFMAGILPGILVGLCIMAASGIIAVRQGYGKTEAAAAAHAVRPLLVCWRALPSLLLVAIIIGGILKGIFTATEAAAISVAYAFLLSVVCYREIPWRDLPEICLQTGLTTAVVMLLIGASSSMSWIMTMANIPQTVSRALMGLSENPTVILLTINAMLLVVGMFMDMTPALLIFTPILLPVVRQLGLSDIHFGIIMIANLCIGLCTPPVGTCLFIGCGVGRTTIAKVTAKALPFFAAMIIALMLITYVPWLSLAIPKACGLLK